MKMYRIVNDNGFKSDWIVAMLSISDMQVIYDGICKYNPSSKWQLEWKDVD